MLVTFLILFRESLEAFLLAGILIVYLRRLGGQKYVKWIFVGVVAGLIGSFVAAFILQVVVDQFNNEFYRAMLSAGIMVIATGILTYMAIWMQKQARAHTEHAKEQLRNYMTAGNVLGVIMLAFFSVWREGIETVLFLSALAYTGEPISAPGALLGMIAAILLIWLLMTGTRKVPLHLFFQYTSLLLIIIAAGLLGSAVNMLQSAHIVPQTGVLFDISGILPDTTGVGVFLRGLFGYNASPTLPQFALWAIYLIVAVTLWRRGYAAKA
ncbi:MAG: FTR1 family iron permease [Rhizobiaceae bacterium]